MRINEVPQLFSRWVLYTLPKTNQEEKSVPSPKCDNSEANSNRDELVGVMETRVIGVDPLDWDP
jgi:hypothetical protein